MEPSCSMPPCRRGRCPVDRERFEVGKAVVGQMDSVQDGAAMALLVLSSDYLKALIAFMRWNAPLGGIRCLPMELFFPSNTFNVRCLPESSDRTRSTWTSRTMVKPTNGACCCRVARPNSVRAFPCSRISIFLLPKPNRSEQTSVLRLPRSACHF